MRNHFLERWPFASNSHDYALLLTTIACVGATLAPDNPYYTVAQAEAVLFVFVAMHGLILLLANVRVISAILWAEEASAFAAALQHTAYMAKELGNDEAASIVSNIVVGFRNAFAQDKYRSGWMRWAMWQATGAPLHKLIYGVVSYAMACGALYLCGRGWVSLVPLVLVPLRVNAAGEAGRIGDELLEVMQVFDDSTLDDFVAGKDSNGSHGIRLEAGDEG